MNEFEDPLTHEVLARGVCLRGGCVLLCRHKGMRRSFLPGGHIDPGESGARALAREIREEMGLEARDIRFIGTSEHMFELGGSLTCEISLCYTMELDGVSAEKNLRSEEDWIEFFWHPVEGLESSGLQPFPLVKCLPSWLKNEGRQNFASSYGVAPGFSQDGGIGNVGRKSAE